MKSSFSLFLGLCASSVYASYSGSSTEHRLAKRDPSGVLATNTYQNCVVRDLNYHAKRGGHQHCDDGIQMAECHVNSRVMNQVFAVFEPAIGSNLNFEGAWYGRCCGYSIYPEDSDMGEVANPNYVCMTWETPDKKQGNGPPTMPQTKIMPFPIICPSTLKNCYSKNYYAPGQTMAGAADNVPLFTGFWGSPKSPKTNGGGGVHQWCDHMCGGCEIGTWFEFRSDRISNLKCDYSTCKPYKGNKDAKINIQTVGTLPPVNLADYCQKEYGTTISYSDAAGGHKGSGNVTVREPTPVGSGGKGQGSPKKSKHGHKKSHPPTNTTETAPNVKIDLPQPVKKDEQSSPQYEQKRCGEETVDKVEPAVVRRHLHQSGGVERSLF